MQPLTKRPKLPKTFEEQQKIDIFALGIILADLLCNPGDLDQAKLLDKDLKADIPRVPEGYDLEGTPEGKILLFCLTKDA